MGGHASHGSRPPDVRLVDGDDASGMATMLAELLVDNLDDYPGRARVARTVRGQVVMTAADRARSVTVTFAGAEITIADGPIGGAPEVTGEWLDLAQLCSGRLSPFEAVARRKMRLHRLRRIDLLAAAGFVMSVPASYYGDGSRWTRWRIALAIGVVVLAASCLALLGYFRRPDRPG